MDRSVRSPMQMIIAAIIPLIGLELVSLPSLAQDGKHKAVKKERTHTVLVARPEAKPEPASDGQGHSHNLARYVLDPDELAARENGNTAKQVPKRTLTSKSSDTHKSIRTKEKREVSLKDSLREPNAWNRRDFDGDGTPNISDAYPFDPSRH